MNVTFYVTNSDKRKLNKTLSTVCNYNAVKLKDSTSIIDPILIVTAFDNFPHCNYLYIKEFNRYYFVEDIISLANNLLEFRCHVDVLMSNKDKIYSMSGIVKRNTNLFNDYLVDNNRKVLCYPTQTIINFPSSSGFNTNLQYILTVAGGRGSV